MSTITDASEIRHELALLTSRVEAVETRLSQNGSATPSTKDAAPPTIALAGIMSQVREITQELFPGKCEFTSEFDPEYPEDRYVVVNVEATGEIKEIVDRECVWVERIGRLSEELFRTLRLSIRPL